MRTVPVTDVALRIAASLVFTREQGYNRGQAVEAFLQYVTLNPGDPWCAAFVSYVLGHTLPGEKIMKAGGCAILGEWAVAHQCLEKTPQAGDVFLIWHTIKHDDGTVEHRFGHTGFVLSVNADGSYLTIEGNAADPLKPASRDGNGVYKGRTRIVGPKDAFIRWSKLYQ